MASPLVSRAPQCMSCIRRLAGSLGNASKPGSQSYQQIRGKKKLAKITAKVHVRLIKNMPTYGRKGTVLSLAPGLMRNSFYPKKVAEYITPAQLREIGIDKVVERDRAYKHSGVQETKRDRQEREKKEMRLMQREVLLEQDEIGIKEDEEEAELELPDLLSPQRSTEILENLLPSYLEFYRSPIVVAAQPVKKRLSPSIPATSAISAAASEGKVAEKATGKTSIYGSVSTADIAANLKALLAEDEEGSRVILSPDDIAFVEAEGEEKDRVKHLGIFEVDITLKGAVDIIRRSVKVTAQA